MSRITSQQIAATFFKVHPRTIGGWISRGFITGYATDGKVLVDLDEIEEALKTNIHMRDGRRPKYGPAAKIVPLPPTPHSEVHS